MADIEAQKRWLASQRTAVAPIECLELSHPEWPQSYRVTTRPGGVVTPDRIRWLYVPMSVTPPSSSDDLKYRIPITLQDMNQDGVSNGLVSTVRDLADLIPADDATPISCVVRGYLQYDDGTISGVTEGPYALQVVEVSFGEQGATFTAQPKQVNNLPCGERITLERFPQAVQWT